MTNQDVINFLNQIRKILLDDKSWLESTIQPINEAFDMAISALEKQIPKKPKSVFCPQCGEEFTDDDCWSSDYCRKCGQAIDWEGE